MVITSLQAGGMERVMAELIWYFSKREIGVDLILFGIKRDVFYEIPHSVNIYRPSFTFNNKYRFVYTLRTMLFLRSQIKQINPPVILSFGELWNNMVLLSTYGLITPIYVSDRAQPDKSLGRLHDYLRSWLYPKAKGIILQSEKAKHNFTNYITGKNPNIKVIGNPIREIQPKAGLKRKKTVLMVARLIRSKHQDRLIRIFATIDKPDWQLVLVGYDHLKQNNMEPLKTLAKSLGVADRVVFAGKQDDIDHFLLTSSIFAFTSSSEGFPNAIGEAMSAGLPVVAYDCIAGPSEMIQDGYSGFLIPLFDDESFRQKLVLLMENEGLRKSIGDKAKDTIKQFAVEQIGEKFFKFILHNE